MQTIAECEQAAAECRRLAAQMKNPQQKKQMEEMAEVWERLARQHRRASLKTRLTRRDPNPKNNSGGREIGGCPL